MATHHKTGSHPSSKSDHGSHTTTDHREIKEWAEQRHGKPACVKGTGGREDVGLLRIDFPGYTGEESLQEISWDEFFEKFDERNLALLYQEETSEGELSNFNKLIDRESEDDGEHKRKSGKSSARHGRGRE